MSKSTVTTSKVSIRRPGLSLVWTACAGVIIMALVVAAYLIGPFWNRPSLQDRLATSAQINPVVATQQLCENKTGCLEAWNTSLGAFLRFERAGQAEYWQQVLGEQCLRNGSIILDLRGTALGLDQRQRAVDILFSDKDWF